MKGTAPEYILAVESSCDESAVALVQNGREVIAERVASQTALHATAGGVVPEAAARAHHEQLPYLLDEVLDEAEIAGIREKISGVAVTAGPGLIGSLIVGTGLAHGLDDRVQRHIVRAVAAQRHARGIHGLDRQIGRAHV